MGKRGQILASFTYRRVTMRKIAANTEVQLATCGNIIYEVKRRSKESANSDLWTDQNIAQKPSAEKGCNALVTLEGKQALIDLTLLDFEHYQISCGELAWEGGFMGRGVDRA